MFNCFGKRECPFCHVTQDNGFHIVHQTDDLIAFHDRSPAGKLHLLIVPRKHIKTVNQLTKADVPLLQSMMALGKQLLQEHGHDTTDDEQYRLGFHRPPFNSVQHLHLHVIGLPFKNRFRAFKYQSGRPWYWDAARVLQGLGA
ncbi:HIT-like domain-containing protein [Gongronella butleri]|nr:HIT-like domain-containing protein [Gongronella butleri]